MIRKAPLNKWLDQKDDLLAGREPRATEDGLTVRSLVNQFLESKEALVESGELTRRHWEDCKLTGTKLVEVFGRNRLVTDLYPTDFKRLRKELIKGHGKKRRGHGPTTLTNDIGRVRVVFNCAYKQGLVDRPIVFGEDFKKPSRRTMRRERQKKGPKMFTARQIRAMTRKAGPQLKAMILLGDQLRYGQPRLRHASHIRPRPENRMADLPPSQDRNRATLPALAGNR